MDNNHYILIADDTEYGYHSASSSSAEHHAQLGTATQQQHQPMATTIQQQNYYQGQNQSQVSSHRISPKNFQFKTYVS